MASTALSATMSTTLRQPTTFSLPSTTLNARFFRLPTTTTRGSRLTMMATYKVTLITPSGTSEIECPDDMNIVEAAEEAGIDLPYSCRAGSCSSCAGIIKEGKVDQDEASFLDDEQMAAGWVLTCVAKPLSNVVVETHKEDEI